jgi:hypothetical protein
MATLVCTCSRSISSGVWCFPRVPYCNKRCSAVGHNCALHSAYVLRLCTSSLWHEQRCMKPGCICLLACLPARSCCFHSSHLSPWRNLREGSSCIPQRDNMGCIGVRNWLFQACPGHYWRALSKSISCSCAMCERGPRTHPMFTACIGCWHVGLLNCMAAHFMRHESLTCPSWSSIG